MNSQQLNQFLSTKITLAQLDIILVELPQKEVFKSAIGIRKSREAIIIRWTDNDGDVGYGECSCRPDPFYSHEFVEGAVAVIKNFLFPLISSISTYNELVKAMNKVRGWNFTKAAIEFAANDLLRKKTGQGIIEASGLPSIQNVPVGISLGLFESVDKLVDKVAEVEDQHYQRLKFKISKGYAQPNIIQAFGDLTHPNVAFDANGAFNDQDLDELSKFSELGKIIEQPFPPSFLYLYQEYLKDYSPFKICLDEEIASYGQLVSNSLQMDELNIKPGRVGGLYTTLRMIEYTQEHGISTWIGGMFETSIGRALNLQVAALLPNAKAHDLSPSSRYFSRDLVLNPIEMQEGYINNSSFENPEIDIKTLQELTTAKIELKNV